MIRRLIDMSIINWTDCLKQLPPSAGEYLVTYYPCYWDEVNKKELKVGLDTFRGVSSWAKKKYQFVIGAQIITK